MDLRFLPQAAVIALVLDFQQMVVVARLVVVELVEIQNSLPTLSLKGWKCHF